MKKIYKEFLMDKELEHHDLQGYESLIKYYMVPDLEKSDKLPGQKSLNPKMMNETNSVVKKKLGLAMRNLLEKIYFLSFVIY